MYTHDDTRPGSGHMAGRGRIRRPDISFEQIDALAQRGRRLRAEAMRNAWRSLTGALFPAAPRHRPAPDTAAVVLRRELCP